MSVKQQQLQQPQHRQTSCFQAHRFLECFIIKENKTESLISRDSRAKVGKLKKYSCWLSQLKVDLSWKSISVESQFQLKVNLSWKLITVEGRSQLKVDLSWKLNSVESWSQLKVDLSWQLILVESWSQLKVDLSWKSIWLLRTLYDSW